MTQTPPPVVKRRPVPRGIARSGLVVFSYGFRPFFLAAGLWAVAAMVLWVGALAMGWQIGGSYGGAVWHAHEMLFGYGSAALAGFLLTAVPNWTGRLPVAGTPLIVLFGLWCAGRLALLAPDILGLALSIALDSAFLPLLLAICAREIIAGRKWKDLKILAGILALALANLAFHLLIAHGGDASIASRLGIAAFTLLITVMGGRVVPSFTRNWLARRPGAQLPAPYDRFDTLALLAGLAALAAWVVLPAAFWSGMACLLAGGLHLARLWRWRGWQCWDEKLVLVLHLGYAFAPVGFFAVALTQLGWAEPVAALNFFTVGAIGIMTLAIMSRATRGHTGMPLAASTMTTASYAALIAAALLRPLSSALPDLMTELLSATGLCWIIAFALYVIEYGPVLLQRRRERGG